MPPSSARSLPQDYPVFIFCQRKHCLCYSRQEKLDEGHAYFEAADQCPGREEEIPKYNPRLQVVPMQWPSPGGSPGFSKFRVLGGE